MAVRLRLMRMGKKKQPTYRIVAADARSPRDGRFLQIIGTYDPRTEPSSLKVDNAAALKWLQDGARPSEAVEKLFKISGVWESYTTGAPLPADPAATEPTDANEATRAEAPTAAPEATRAAEPAEAATDVTDEATEPAEDRDDAEDSDHAEDGEDAQ